MYKMNLLLVVAGLSFLYSGSVLSQEVTTQCPDGWTRWQGYCYLFVNTTWVTWEDAKGECEDRMGHQLRIESLDEYDFVKKAQMLFHSDSYWTALNDLAVNEPNTKSGTFMWGSDSFPLDVVVKNNWDKEPDNTPYDDCVAVDIQGACSVENCANRHAYICELTKTSSEVCPNYWVSMSNDSNICYFVSNATAWSQTVRWDKARKTCESLVPFKDTRKARMLTITSQQVQDFLASHLSLVFYGRQLFWTGLNDKNTEGSFVWAGNEGTLYQGQYLKWRHEPNNLAGHEHCGVLQPGGRWGDRNCDDKVNFACRLALPDTPNLFNMGCGTWTRAGRKCSYIYSRPLKNWKDSRAFCQAQGGDLYKYYNDDDASWLATQANARMSLPAYWIGLNDQKTENSWAWADGSYAEKDSQPWDKEPNGYGLARCGAMDYSGSFIDMSCWKQKAGTICERPSTMCSASTGWYGYGGHCYLVDTTYRTVGEAKGLCHDASPDGTGRLFVLNSQDEKNWIVKQIGQKVNGTMFYWSGLTLSHKSWQWPFLQDNYPMNIQQLVTWSSEPNNWRNNEDCVEVNVNGGLNDADCSQNKGFVCQKWAPGFSAATVSLSASSLRLLLIALVSVAVVASRWLW